jgi:cytochrome bd ubiquinol oxidase subunit II
MAYVPVVFILAGMTAYTVLAGADFGAGLWTLLATGPHGQQIRDQARHAMGPVWEANHVWLIFVLVVCWTAYPVAFGSITSTLAAPLLIAAIGIIFRGAAYALRGQGASRAAENLFAASSVLTPFALGTAVGAIATGRVPVGNAAGDPVTSWLNPPSVLTGALAVAFSGYLAAVYLAADSTRFSGGSGGKAPRSETGRTLATAFRYRALVAGVVSGALALGGLFVMRNSGLDLTHGAALAMVCVSGVAGLATLALCWGSAFGLARLTAAVAVAAVVVGWAVAQAPRFLPGMTVTQAAAGRSTLVALIIAVACGSVILIPSLALLFTLFLRGRLDTPEHHAPANPEAAPAEAASPAAPSSPATPLSATASPTATSSPGTAPSRSTASSDTTPPPATAPSSAASSSAAAPASGDAGAATPPSARARAWGGAAIAGLVAGAGLLVFADAAWAHGVGVASLVLCAVAVFRLASAPPVP